MRNGFFIWVCFLASLFQYSYADKPVCLLYGNCQTQQLYYYLQASFPDEYEYRFIMNWGAINDNRDLSNCWGDVDFLIYQPVVGHGSYDTDFIKSSCLKPSCKLFSHAYFYMAGYFPDNFHAPENAKTVTPGICTYGAFPYASSALTDLIQSGLSFDEVYAASQKESFISAELTQQMCEESLKILEWKEMETDIQLAGFIRENYRKERLFYTVNHPAPALYEAFFAQVIEKLGLPSDPNLSTSFFITQWGPIVPIWPSVRSALQLEFDPGLSKGGDNRPLTDHDYIESYMSQLYPEFWVKNGPQYREQSLPSNGSGVS